MDDTSDPISLSDAVEGARFAMFTTVTADRISSRPLTLAEADDSTLRFLVSRAADWVSDLEAGSVRHAAATIADPGANRWVSLAGTATLTGDPAMVHRLWNPAARAFFDGSDDPSIRVLELHVDGGEWWDGPSGRVGRLVAVARAAVTGDASAAGGHGSIDVP